MLSQVLLAVRAQGGPASGLSECFQVVPRDICVAGRLAVAESRGLVASDYVVLDGVERDHGLRPDLPGDIPELGGPGSFLRRVGGWALWSLPIKGAAHSPHSLSGHLRRGPQAGAGLSAGSFYGIAAPDVDRSLTGIRSLGAVSRMVSSITLLFGCPSWNYPTQDQCLGEVCFPLVLETPATPSEEKPWAPQGLSDLSSVLVGMALGRGYPGLRPRGACGFPGTP